jgi:hypothetical protein
MKGLGLFKMYSKQDGDRFWITSITDFGRIVETEITGIEWKEMAMSLQDQGISPCSCGSDACTKYTYYALL